MRSYTFYCVNWLFFFLKCLLTYLLILFFSCLFSVDFQKLYDIREFNVLEFIPLDLSVFVSARWKTASKAKESNTADAGVARTEVLMATGWAVAPAPSPAPIMSSHNMNQLLHHIAPN